ncbi:3-hydroxyacyl-CoA dehydrogenase NAD-binding domain-containing protein [Yoonia sp.]|uniref:3-hydroxyacyl-CoA dehydrogenase family protein n=1 Tax=Yoonia sp. TaxID=2212373 RepID=UPI0025D65279|nr:3-hydroxyacyl-CoA dehydrogenase NAD-binding domain-containing protein [Yoonia sp.]
MRSEASGSVAIVGGGTMGTGMVYVFAAAGFDTILVEPDSARQDAVSHQLEKATENGVARGKLSAEQQRAVTSGVETLENAGQMPKDLGLVIETVPERLEVKESVLRAISRRTPKLIASNTSAMSIDQLSRFVAEPENFFGMHFFNPVWSLPLVEIIRGTATGDAALTSARAYAEAIGKTSITVSDTPGFATSRLDLIAAMEAIRMVEDGVASPEDIDRAMVVAYRHPIGPLRLSDIVGLDVRLDIARGLSETLGPRYAPPRILEDMVARGDLGQKTGRGFYDWTEAA